MKGKVTLFCILFFLLVLSVFVFADYQLVIGDSFGDSSLDLDKWVLNNGSIPYDNWHITETTHLYIGENYTGVGSNYNRTYISLKYKLNSTIGGYAEVKYQRVGDSTINANYDFCLGSETEKFPNSWCGICFADSSEDFYFHYPTGSGTLRLSPTISTGGDSNEHTIRIVASRITNSTGSVIATYYQNYFDGVLINSHNQTGSCKSPIINATITTYDTSASSVLTIGAYQNFSFYSEIEASLIGTLQTGEYCGKDSSLCISGWCEYQFCGLKPGKIACVFNNECASGVCAGGHCTQPSLWNGIDASKSVFFGSDTSTGNIIALFIMIVSAIASASVSPLLAPFVFVAEAVFFAVVGWLSVFILVGIILVGIIAGALAIMLNTGG